MKVILISGKAGSGKDTAAQMLRHIYEDCGKRVLVTHFADLVKYIARAYFGWDGQKDEAGRALLQRVGTDEVRRAEPGFWCCFISRLLSIYHDRWDYVIIPDARFQNEVSGETWTGFDTVHLRVVRERSPCALRGKTAEHISETGLDGVEPDRYISNHGDLADLWLYVSAWATSDLFSTTAAEHEVQQAEEAA